MIKECVLFWGGRGKGKLAYLSYVPLPFSTARVKPCPVIPLGPCLQNEGVVTNKSIGWFLY